ncbi:MAG TPA: hypothetical protein VFA47_07215 [Candidatus Manganitrophaceae bacterium]|nr:hypothetical protein [Candidatus Manganitrophaceae bacterium]
MRNCKRRWLASSVFLFFLAAIFFPAGPSTASTVYDCASQENKDKQTTVEILLAGKWKGKTEEVKQSFASDRDPNGGMKVRVKFFPFLDPPKNIGIGKCVSADNARLAIREAIKLNGGIDRLVMQEIMPHHWIKIGTTDTSELTWIPVGPEELARLSDPALSTDQFQELYRRLARQKEKRHPFGMDSEKREETP